MSDRPGSSSALRPPDIDVSSENGKRSRAKQTHSEDFSIYVGALVPLVGRPVAIVTYRRSISAHVEGRHAAVREAATYWAFFTHEQSAFSSALCQRSYHRGVYPRLGAKAMMERGRDEAELALNRWLTAWLRASDHEHVKVRPFEMQKTDRNELFGLYVFSPAVRACVQACVSALSNDRLRTVLAGWAAEMGVNTVPLHVPTAS